MKRIPLVLCVTASLFSGINASDLVLDNKYINTHATDGVLKLRTEGWFSTGETIEHPGLKFDIVCAKFRNDFPISGYDISISTTLANILICSSI